MDDMDVLTGMIYKRRGSSDAEAFSEMNLLTRFKNKEHCVSDLGAKLWQEELEMHGLRDGMSPQDLLEALQKKYGCSRCDNYGNNGCGCSYIDGLCFGSDDNGKCWVDSAGHEFECDYYNQQEHDHMRLLELERQVTDGTLVFVAAIKAALELMPINCKSEVYGDIVRSAAAVACHQNIKVSEE